jgi:hypothetical protein
MCFHGSEYKKVDEVNRKKKEVKGEKFDDSEMMKKIF